MKYTNILLGAIVVLLGVGMLSGQSVQNLGGDFSYGSWTSKTSATSSVITAATTTALYSGASYDGVKLEICNTASNPVYLYFHPSTISTTTAATFAVGKGTIVDGFGNTTSTALFCRSFDNFKGNVYGIAAATSTIQINYSR
jgi:hypothetical protein